MSESSPRRNRRSRTTYIFVISCSHAVLAPQRRLTTIASERFADGRAPPVCILREHCCWHADPFVDYLPDLLVQLVLLPDAVGGPQQHRRDSYQPDRPAYRRVDPLVAPKADAQLTLR